MAIPGPLALISQSGALTASILDWAKQNQVGFSNVISLGPYTSVDIAQVLDYLASDAQTHSIVIYLEGISNARGFMSALRSAARAKPVVVLKAGRKAAGNRAAQTHSGAIVGSDDVFDAALRRAGAVRVRSFVELFSAAKCLASRYRPVGNRLAIITNGGGPGVLPAGKIDAGEDILLTGQRELLEETGYVAQEWVYLGLQHPCIGYSDEVIYMFIAKGLKAGEAHCDEDEALELFEASLDDCLQMIATQQITDAKTILALMYLEKHLQGIWPALTLNQFSEV